MTPWFAPNDPDAGLSASPPPPEETTLHLTDVDPDRRANATLGVRSILTDLRRYNGGYVSGSDDGTVRAAEAQTYVDRFLAGEGPVLLGTAPNALRARLASHRGVEAAKKAISIGIGLSPDEVEERAAEAAHEPEPKPEPITQLAAVPADDAEDWAPAVKLAMNLLAQHNGNFVVAEAWAKIMLESDPDGLWDEVLEIIRASFPPPLTGQ